MVERAIQATEAEVAPRNPHQEILDILRVDDSIPWTKIVKEYEAEDVNISISIRRNRSAKDSTVFVALSHEDRLSYTPNRKDLSASYHIKPNGTISGLIFGQPIPGVDNDLYDSPRNGHEVKKSRAQAIAVVDFVKTKILPQENPKS